MRVSHSTLQIKKTWLLPVSLPAHRVCSVELFSSVSAESQVLEKIGVWEKGFFFWGGG